MKKTCLVVDDVSTMRRFASALMQGLSFKTLEAENGQQALTLIREEMPDVILLDWRMPEMDGMEFLSHFLKVPGSENCAVLFCTAKDEPDHIHQAMSLGAAEYIMKPFDLDILRSKLEVVGLLNMYKDSA